MPQSSNSRRVLFRLVLFTLAGWALWALGRNDARPADQETAAEATPAREPARARTGFSKRRLATSLAFATLFFAGAAFSAGAGDKVAQVLDGSTPTVLDPVGSETEPQTVPTATESTETGSTDTQSTETGSTETQSTETGSTETQSTETGSTGPTENEGAGNAGPTNPDDQSSEGDAAPASGGEDEPAVDDAPGGGGSGGANEPVEVPDPPAAGPGSPSHTGDQVRSHVPVPEPVDVDEAHDAAVAAENAGSFGTFWLHRTLPDPTPAAKRLDRRFARMLVSTSRHYDVDWALVLGVLRARGHYDRIPASEQRVARVAAALHRLHASRDAWQAVLALSGRTAFADRVVALAHYDRAVGLRGLVRGLLAAKASLQHRVLADDRISIYAGGRSDIAAGRIDVRILALLRYLAEAHGSVTVSCLISGHGLYARPGVVSRHIYGEAVDIAALGGRSIYGNQEPGGLTERAVRNILLLPVELRPQQVISLLGLGGPSFALANHYDHIHVGF
jgi:hypothetical protein